jgi:hypothetical protein
LHQKVSYFRKKILEIISSFKGNLLLLPAHVSIFGLRTTTNDGNQSLTSVDNQRAMKQLEMSNKIQTGLELKIDTLKKEIRM